MVVLFLLFHLLTDNGACSRMELHVGNVATEEVAIAQLGEPELCQGHLELCKCLVVLTDGKLCHTWHIDVESLQFFVFRDGMFGRIQVSQIYIIRCTREVVLVDQSQAT